MKTIGEILLSYETDKNLGVNKNGHYYGESYDTIFETFDRDSKLNILEIGVQKGASLQAWKDYFTNSNVYGIDIIDVRLDKYKKEDLIFILSDIKNPELLNDPLLKDTYFDIIIDDGSHYIEDVVHMTQNFIHRLNVNGYLIIEDAQAPEMWINQIRNILSHHSNFELSTIDLRHVNNLYDDYLIVIKRVK
jgi:hypothetical protein